MQGIFYKKVAVITLPILLQYLLDAAVNSADVLMLNYVGQTAISAAALATQYSSILYMVFYGMGAGAQILAAQYYGKGDLKSVSRVLPKKHTFPGCMPNLSTKK